MYRKNWIQHLLNGMKVVLSKRMGRGQALPFSSLTLLSLPPFTSWRTGNRASVVMSWYIKPRKRGQCTRPRGVSKQFRTELRISPRPCHLTFSSHPVSTSWAFLSAANAGEGPSVHWGQHSVTLYVSSTQLIRQPYSQPWNILKPLHNVVHLSEET